VIRKQRGEVISLDAGRIGIRVVDVERDAVHLGVSISASGCVRRRSISSDEVGQQAAGDDLVEAIRDAIKKRGGSLSQLGSLCGIDRTRLSRFMRSEGSLSLSAASRLCATLGLQLNGQQDAP
jgi:DNA-binding phage protein